MKAKRITELMNWLNESTRVIDLPRDFTKEEVKRMIDIAENEAMGNDVEAKIAEFKANSFKDCDIKSQTAKDMLSSLEKNLGWDENFKISESQAIRMIEIAESEI